MSKRFFVTGTDTEVGKTVITEGFVRLAGKRYKAAGYKPVASDAQETAMGLQNSDALTLQKAASVSLSYSEVNPYVFVPPLSPHVAAKLANVNIDEALITKGLLSLAKKTDLLFVEGAGGWHVPISDERCLSSWAIEQSLPVILVVGMKLGCLNHALLTAQAIEAQGGQLIGWVANHASCVSDKDYDAEMMMWLHRHLPCPCLGVVPYLGRGQSAADFLTLPL